MQFSGLGALAVFAIDVENFLDWGLILVLGWWRPQPAQARGERIHDAADAFVAQAGELEQAAIVRVGFQLLE